MIIIITTSEGGDLDAWTRWNGPDGQGADERMGKGLVRARGACGTGASTEGAVSAHAVWNGSGNGQGVWMEPAGEVDERAMLEQELAMTEARARELRTRLGREGEE